MNLVDRARKNGGEKSLSAAPTRGEIFGIIDTLSEVLIERIKEIEARMKTLEQREYQGVHVEGREYTRGQTCTHAGSIWHCNRKTTQKPGECSDWTLAVKKGRDGNNSR